MADELDIDAPSKAALFRIDCLYGVIEHTEARGFVVWDATPPTNVCYQTHKFSFIDAFQTAFAFLRTRFQDQKILLGPVAASIVVTLPQFIVLHPIQPQFRCVHIGKLMMTEVYADPDMADSLGWYAIDSGQWCRGLIQNSPVAMGPLRID